MRPLFLRHRAKLDRPTHDQSDLSQPATPLVGIRAYHRHVPMRRLRLVASDEVVEAGLEQIRAEMSIPSGFDDGVMAEVAATQPDFPELDLTAIPFITIDPPGSRDLDQALHLEQTRRGYRVSYAIADVATFVVPGGAVDTEAHLRGQTFYGPDVRTPLYPPELSEMRASLLPDETRPALVWQIELDEHGEITSGTVKRAMVRSRAQLTYDEVQGQLESGAGDTSLRLLAEVGRLRQMLEVERGAVTLDIPEQQIYRRDGGWDLSYRMPLPVEGWNAQLSILTGVFSARTMAEAGVGILRTLPEADPVRLERLHRVAKGLMIAWPADVAYPDLIRSLDGRLASHAAFLAEATGLFAGAGYQILTPGQQPKSHSALATPYAHTTAPLRRLVDRYAGETCLAIIEGRDLPEWVAAALPGLPVTMARSSTRAGQYEAACVNLVEAALLSDHIGDVFRGVVVEAADDVPRGEVQLRRPAVLAAVDGEDLDLGEEIMVEVSEASIPERRVRFQQI